MTGKLYTTTYKLMDFIVLLTMILAGPFNISAVSMAQVPAPILSTDKTDYAPGEIAHVTGADFTPGDYVLAAMAPDGTVVNWATVTADDGGFFASDSPALDSAGSYELRAYAADWAGDWSEAAQATVGFSVTAPPAATEPPAVTEPPVATQPPAATEPPAPTPVLLPYIQSDKADYAPGEFVTLTGGNWQGDTQVRVFVNDDAGKTWSRDVIVNVAADGTIIDQFNLPNWFVATYVVSASGQQTGRTVTTSFTDADASPENLWQCDPPSGYTPSTYTCETSSATGWVTGNDDGPFAEGETVPYRTRLNNMVSGTQYSISIQWDTTKGGKHAIDYLKSWNATITAANPCLSLNKLPAGLCSTSTTWPIPADTFMQADAAWIANAGVQDAGVFTMYGGTITGVSSYTNPPNYVGDTSTSIILYFTATSTDAVLAWGGHIAERDDWGLDNSAVAIPGSPYHMRLLAMYDVTHNKSLNVGNTDRSLSAEAVIYPASITVIKEASSEGSQVFPFTASPSPLSNFNLVDDGTTANTKVFNNIRDFKTYTVAESVPTNWALTSIVCSVTSPNGGSQTVTSPSVSINLKEGENVTCTFNNTRTFNPNLTVTKTAVPSFGRTYTWDIYKDVDKTTANITDGGLATFKYTVGVTHDNGTDSGYTVSGVITVHNPNAFDVAGVNVTDAATGGTCTVTNGTNLTVPAGKDATANYSCLFNTNPGSGTNTATAAWDASAYNTPAGSASGTANYDFAGVTPSIKNTSVTVTDTLGGNFGPVSYTDTSPKEFTYSHTFSGVGGTCTKYDNTATINENGEFAKKTVEVCVGKDLTVSKTASGTFDRTYLWKISKDVNATNVKIADGASYTFQYTVDVEQTGISDAGWILSGKITITNPNDWEDITLTSLDDVVDNGGTCTVGAGPYVVPASGSIEVGYSCSYSKAPSSYSGKNTATAEWDKAAAFTPTGSASGSADFTLGQDGAANQTVHVTDTYGGDLGAVTATDSAPFASASFTYDRKESGVAGTCTKYDNTATITETDQSADKQVTLCVGKDLTVSKTASGTFDRTYLWKIDKDVNATNVKIADGASYTFNYTVDVEQTGISDAGWILSGKITITNPNDWEDITLTSLGDVVDNGGTCTVDPGPYKVLAGKTLDVNYSCAYDSAPSSYSGKNTATAEWDKAAAFTPTGSASGSADFTLGQDDATNQTVHVTDTYGGDLGTVTATDSAPFASASFTYDRKESGVAGTCTKYDNTATITETGQSADKQVTLCVGKDLTVSKTASGTFDRTYLWKISKDVNATNVKIADGASYTFQYTVDVEQTGISDAGWTLSGKITITNPNDWEAITLTSLGDVVDNGGTCTVDAGPYVVPASDSIEVGYSCSYSKEPSSYSGKNTATAEWDKAAAFTPTGSASGSADFTLTQKGSTNKTINVTDTYQGALGTVTANDTAPWAKGTFTYDRKESGVAGTCTDYTNTAAITETNQSASKTVTLCVAKDLTVSKTASGTFDRTYLWKISKDVNATNVKIADGASYTFNYTVDVEQTGISDAGWTLSGKITITNPNDWEDITLTSLADVVDNGGTCTVDPGPYKVLAGKTLDVNYSCAYDSAPSSYSGKNTATAEWDKAAAFTPTGSASGSADFTLSQAGSTNKLVHVTDTYGGDLGTVTATDNAPFASASFTYDRTEKGVGGKCTDYDNTATITETGQSADKQVTLCVAKDLTVSKTASGTFDRTYLWKISKDVNATNVKIADGASYTFNYTVDVEQTGISDAGWILSGKITITNPNDWEDITLTSLGDVVDNGGTCTVDAGPYTVLAGKTLDVNYSCAYDSAPTSYSGKNTATAEWDKAAAFTPTGSASGSADFTLTQKGSTNKTINVTDTYQGALGTVTAKDTAPWAKGTFTYDRKESGVAGTCTKYDNTAKITETGATASKTVTLCVGKDLTVTKTASGTFDRTYLWKIDKSVDKNYVTTINTPVNFNYAVTVTQTGVKDSNWALSGKITITNPNDWEDITLTSLTDVVDNGGTCSVDPGPYKVLAGKSLEVAYKCTYTSASSNSGTNTATAMWNKATYFTPNGTASGKIDFALVQKGSTNKTVTVTDTYAGTLGTVTANDIAPWASKTFTYTRSINPPSNKICEKYDNTAKIVETGQSDSETVQVCLPSLVTSSSLCTFDYDTSMTGNQFRLMFTPSVGSPSYKLNASNPGQFYYNLFYSNDTDQPVTPTVTITLPYPFVTQGAVPIHAYSGVTVTQSNGQYCLTPGTEIFNTKQFIVTLDNYSPQAMGSTTTLNVVLPTIPAGGFVYTNIHLDYGLKDTLGYGKDGSNNATAYGTTNILVPDKNWYGFADNLLGIFSHSVQSINVFKKNPGVGGKGFNNTTTDPIPMNTKVLIYNASKKLLGTVYTDQDGWYMWSYKYTGKPSTFYITMPAYGITKTVTLKSNGYLEVNFGIP